MTKILLRVAFMICVVRGDTPQCPTDGTPYAEKGACQCRTTFCSQFQTCQPEGDGGKGFCKAQLTVAVPENERLAKCPMDGTPNTDKNPCECNFQNSVICLQHQTCDPAGDGGKGFCKAQLIVAVPESERLAKCPKDGTPNTDKNPCECNFHNAVICLQHQTCDPEGNEGKGFCKAQLIKPGPKPSGGSGGSGGDTSGNYGGSSGTSGTTGRGATRCRSQDGSLLPSATLCEDRIDSSACRTIFSDDGSGARSSKCDLPELAETALNCAKTCKICCERAEHGCDDDSTFGIDCFAQKSKCKDPQWTAVMAQACPATCGLCNAGACRDVIDGCASMKNLCRDITYRGYMTTNCARTCQACDQGQGAPNQSGSSLNVHASKCVDSGANCGSFVGLCKDASWEDTLRISCTKTCGLC